jgi:hypothetical protein
LLAPFQYSGKDSFSELRIWQAISLLEEFMDRKLSRRSFLKLAGISVTALGASHFGVSPQQPGVPGDQPLGRVVWWGTELKRRPSLDSETIRTLPEDELFPWLRSVVGSHYEVSQTWAETPEGYVWAPHLQPVKDQPNVPLTQLPATSLGQGIWMEVTVPFVDLFLANPPARSPWLQDKQEVTPGPRLYYSQVVWVDQIETNSSGEILYRVNEPYGTYGDIFWAAGAAFRPVSQEEIEPINPDAENKRIVVDVGRQQLHCFEGNSEVYFCRVSTGALYDYLGNKVDAWATPFGNHPIWRKLMSLHMSGGTTGAGWDLPGVAWTTLFVGTGVAIHSTFWHNNFGVPMSRGCVNASPEDAKWVFRWTQPVVPYDPGDITVALPGGTMIQVVEA